jgi:hypothetical protein
VTAARQFQAAPRCRGPVKQARGRSSIRRGRAVSRPVDENINHETLETHERKGHKMIEQIDQVIHADRQLAAQWHIEFHPDLRLGEFLLLPFFRVFRVFRG